MDPTIIVAGISGVSGVLIGFVGGWFSRPAAKAKVDEDTLKRQERRRVIADARKLVATASAKNLPKSVVANDPRYLAVRSALDEGVANAYQHATMPLSKPSVLPEDHTPLLKNLDRLEKQWNLL